MRRRRKPAQYGRDQAQPTTRSARRGGRQADFVFPRGDLLDRTGLQRFHETCRRRRQWRYRILRQPPVPVVGVGTCQQAGMRNSGRHSCLPHNACKTSSISGHVAFHPNSSHYQCTQQGPGHCSAQQGVHAQLGHTASEVRRRHWADDDFLSRDFPATMARDQQQPRRRVQHRRHLVLPNGNGDCHRSKKCKGRASFESRAHRVEVQPVPAKKCDTLLVKPWPNATFRGDRRRKKRCAVVND